MRRLVIVGAGGFARETAQLVHAINERTPTWELAGFLDDDEQLWGHDRDGLTVLGGTELVHELDDAAVVVCVGNPRAYTTRRAIVERLDLPAERYATLVHPMASVSRSSLLGAGTVVHAGCVLTAAVEVGAHVAMMPHVVLTHDDRVGPYVTFGAGVRVAGGVRVDTGAYVGAAASLREGIEIGAWSLIGMGSVVTRSVPPAEVWAGVPARPLRAAAIPAATAGTAATAETTGTEEHEGRMGMDERAAAVDGAEEPIPLVDLGAQHREVEAEVAAAFELIMKSTAFIAGPDVAAFEDEFAARCDVPACVGVANGTDAIELGLRAAGVGRGDRVIVPANTFIATAEAVERAGADVVLVDCDADTMLLDVAAVRAALATGVRAVIGVDLYGQIAPFEQLRAVVGPDVVLIEDAAQSQGAARHGRPIGHGVELAATSFYPGKNLGAYGDGGAVLSTSAELVQRVRMLANHGSAAKYEHDVVGCNSRLDTLQAAVLRAKLRRLPAWNARRVELADRYGALLGDVDGVVLPTVAAGNAPVWHLYVVRVPRRDHVLDRLHRAGIGAGLHYPTPIHLTEAFAHLGHGRGDFPRAEAAARSMISLPLHPHLTDRQQDRVVAVLRDALR